jgi:hypothetical protein
VRNVAKSGENKQGFIEIKIMTITIKNTNVEKLRKFYNIKQRKNIYMGKKDETLR